LYAGVHADDIVNARAAVGGNGSGGVGDDESDRIGFTVSGVVERTGALVDNAEVPIGSNVCAILPLSECAGYAQFAVVDVSLIVPKHPALSHQLVAATILPASMCYNALLLQASVKSGESALVLNASSVSARRRYTCHHRLKSSFRLMAF
jgi:NADPH:quinone reductase-like Zn-dependent oxidoreductase